MGTVLIWLSADGGEYGSRIKTTMNIAKMETLVHRWWFSLFIVNDTINYFDTFLWKTLYFGIWHSFPTGLGLVTCSVEQYYSTVIIIDYHAIFLVVPWKLSPLNIISIFYTKPPATTFVRFLCTLLYNHINGTNRMVCFLSTETNCR